MARSIPQELARLARELKEIKRGQRYAHGGSIENSAVEVKDGTGSLRAIVGVQADGTTAVNIVNGPPPPQPSPPIVTPVLGGVAVSWDGAFADGAVLPLDWQRIEVHASAIDGFTPVPDTLHGTIETPQGSTVVAATDTPVYVRLLARSTSGTASTPSAQAGPAGPAPVVAQELLDGIVTSSKIAAGAVTINALTESLADTASQRYVDAMGDPTAWTVLTKAPAATWTFLDGVTDARTGSTVAQATGYTVVRGTLQMPYDPDVLYRVSVRARTTAASASGTDTLYAGVLGIAADGVTYVNRTGANSYYTQLYPAASNTAQPTASGWVTYTGYLKGHAASGTVGTMPDPRTPGAAHTNVRFLAPLLYLNFGSGTSGDTGTMQVDAFTLEALKTGVVNSSNLVAGSVTTAALAADSVTATHIQANAVTTAKLDAEAVTAAKIAGLTITGDKIAANAITVGKLAAGAVDATALAADAITGKTITGGIINGSLIQTATSGPRVTVNEDNLNKVLVYDATTPTAIGELSERGLLLQGNNGAILWLDPDSAYPNLRFTNAAQTNSAYVNVSETSPGAADLGLTSGVFTGSGFSDMKWRTFMGNDFAVIERIRNADDQYSVGGRFFLSGTSASLGYRDSGGTSQSSTLFVQAGHAFVSGGRFSVQPPASSSSAVLVSVAAGHTGNLLNLTVDGATRMNVDKDGNTDIKGIMTAGNIASGTITITPSAAHTPTSASVNFGPLKGTTFRGYATAVTTVPGVRTPVGAQGVTGVSVSSVTSSSMLVWVNRENTTATVINWMVIAS
ncbi:hypothetical protein [Streptomyces leeuwenhoekii]|uniref:Sle1_005 protein n=1 Tax=Streptomyces leeuwenhoekii TaxID=1437453 RepID=A0A0F7VP65_STRLW|nr:hypothetical protein [Streptomyces leeuwenhoekii]CQR59172.1 sle1_005 [Streptomyces leeuwenhoekii]